MRGRINLRNQNNKIGGENIKKKRKLMKLLKHNPNINDNKSIINNVENLIQHDKTKFIEINRYFVKEKLDCELITTTYIPFKHELTYALIKSYYSNDSTISHVIFN